MALGPLAVGDTLAGLSGSIGPARYDGDDADWYAFSVGVTVGYRIAHCPGIRGAVR